MKKLICMLLAVCLLAACLPLSASAASGTAGPSATFTFDEAAGTVTFSGTGMVEGFPGQTPGSTSNWTNNQDTDENGMYIYPTLVKHAVFEPGITEIGRGVLCGQKNLISVSIPDTVTRIGRQFLEFDSLITEVTIPDSVTFIDYEAFAQCHALQSVRMSKNVKSIERQTFSGCKALTSFEVPEGVTTIGERAFAGCLKLKKITIPASVTSIGDYAFNSADYSGLAIYGKKGSYAETYAKENNIPFVDESAEEEDPAPAVSFTDVPAGSYCADAVAWAVKKGVTKGTGNGTFSPANLCKRAEAVTFLWRAAGEPEPTLTENPFTDVAEGAYYYKAVLWAKENKITEGAGGGKFNPEGSCKRSEIVTFLWRASGRPQVSVNGSFSDVPDDSYYAVASQWAKDNGIAKGVGNGRFGSQDPCQRGQIVTFLYRSMA